MIVAMQLITLAKEHISGVAAIERECFSSPWSEKALEILLGDNAIGVVVIADGEVAAYAGMTCVLDEGQITNVATLPRYRRRGFARAALEALVERAAQRGVCSIFLEARVSNIPAISLYESLGFRQVGSRRRFYSAPVEDAVLMELKI